MKVMIVKELMTGDVSPVAMFNTKHNARNAAGAVWKGSSGWRVGYSEHHHNGWQDEALLRGWS